MDAKRICPYCMQELDTPEPVCPHCGRSLTGRNPSGSLPVGTVLAGRYTVGEIQSIDGEGILYRGVENKGRFRVTVKEYMPLTLAAERGRDCHLRPKPGSEVLFKTTRMDFADLYHAIQRITPANGLEAVLDVFEENNTVYAVMENPGGRPLQTMAGRSPRPRGACRRLCAMLQPVFERRGGHARGGAGAPGHLPANIRVLDNGRARLTGYATVGLRTAGSGLHEQLYEGFSAPEQYSTAEFEGRYTDEYSLAAVFYRMVCGLSPVPAAQRLVSDSNPEARTVNPALPVYLSDVLQYGLRLKPVERIQTVPQLFKALSSQEYTQELARTMKPETAPAAKDPGDDTHLLSLRNLLAAILDSAGRAHPARGLGLCEYPPAGTGGFVRHRRPRACRRSPASPSPPIWCPISWGWIMTLRCGTTAAMWAIISSMSRWNTATPWPRARSSGRSPRQGSCWKRAAPSAWW